MRESERARDGYASLERDGYKRAGVKGVRDRDKGEIRLSERDGAGRRRIEMIKKDGKGEKRGEGWRRVKRKRKESRKGIKRAKTKWAIIVGREENWRVGKKEQKKEHGRRGGREE